MFWKESFLSTSCILISDLIGKFEYKIGGVWKTATIKSSAVNGAKRIYTIEIPVGEGGTITAVRLVDKYGNTAGEKSENILKSAGNSFLMKMTVYLQEGMVS